MWQTRYDKERRVWVIMLDHHELWTVKTKKEAVEICRRENQEARTQTARG